MPSLEIALRFGENLGLILFEAAPWLLVGLMASGLIKAWLPTELMMRWLGGRGMKPILRAAIIGTPLPLCSCSVIPAAATIRRGGASKGSTVSFLIATPENGADSIALSYALLGPFMTIVRPVAALLSAVFSGLLTDTITRHEVADSLPVDAPTKTNGDGCNHSCGSENIDPLTPASLAGAWRRLTHGIRYAVTDLFADIGLWLAIGMVLAAVVNTFVPPGSISQWGSGPLAEETGRLVWQSRGRCEAAGWRADLA